ncbi:hypothetical protein LUZ60_000425 [Juncus effusus]|nr:hypothetical protein LUZ60_000425 [Juncus effusus]
MGSRLREKEDERNERVIRGLAKLPPNRRCINCNSQGTQYVCTNFATFICIHCSGIHREFTHRVKSISMAKFTSQEITALQEGGNENAKKIYFKEWDFQRYTLPDNSDVDKVRDFIKHVYVDRRFMSDRNADKPSLAKNEKEESWIQSRSSRAPGPQHNTEPSPAKNTDTNSDDRQKEATPPVKEPLHVIAPPVKEPVHVIAPPVKEPLHVVAPPVRLLPEPPKLNKPGTPKPTTQNAPVQIQSTIAAASDDTPKSAQNAQEAKPVSSVNLIDFDFDSDREVVAKQQTANPANQSSDVGWASFDTQKAPNPDSSAVHKPSPGPALPTNYSSMVHRHAPGPGPAPATNYSSAVHGPAPGPGPAANYSSLQQASNNPQLNRPAVMGPTNQNWGQVMQPVAPNIRTANVVPNQFQHDQVSQHLMHGPGAPSPAGAQHQSPASSTRNALPEDLFSMVYGGPVPGWRGAPRVMMGYAVQYPTPPPNTAYYHPVRSSNPFDFNTEPKLAHANTFPSMTSLQGALPNLSFSNPNPNPNPNLLSRASSMVSFGSQWGPQHIQQSPYQHQMYNVNMPQQIPSNIYNNGNQVMGGYGTIRNPNSYSQLGGNPFS